MGAGAYLCSNCERDVYRSWYCKVCRRELVCGAVAVPCSVEGCLELRMAARYVDPINTGLAEPDQFVEPRFDSRKEA